MTNGQTPAEGSPERVPARSSNELAETRTSLAFERSYLAAERTLMAWVRTSLSMISFGFTMVKFFEYLDSTRGKTVGPLGHKWAPTTVGFSLMTIGIFALVAAVVQHRQSLRALRQQGVATGWSLALAVASLMAALGVFALGTLLFGW